MFEQNGDKAPDPDGYTAHFFEVAWHIVGADVIRAVLFFFFLKYSKLLPAFNTTTIVLVPKVKNPGHMREFWPISCCSVFLCVSLGFWLKDLQSTYLM